MWHVYYACITKAYNFIREKAAIILYSFAKVDVVIVTKRCIPI